MTINKLLVSIVASATITFSSFSFADSVFAIKIKGIIVQPATNVAIVTFTNTDGKCPDNRVKFNKDDDAVYSFILSAHMADKTVGFQFNPNGSSLGVLSGHGIGKCELINIWTTGA